MDPKRYESHRNRLVDLMDKGLALPTLPDKTRARIRELRRKALEDQFRLVLVGEFGSGKSTTFDALCDGRAISPWGLGLKTSACVLTAQNLADPNEPERCQIEWRDKRRLVEGFADQTLRELSALAPTRFQVTLSREQVGSALDLDIAEDLELARKAIALELDRWRSNKSAYKTEDLDVIRFAALVAQHWGSSELSQHRALKEVSVAELELLITFPTNWESQWSAGDPRCFTATETAFVFIESVVCRVHAQGLERLGCAVVDCPGLFASTWDTGVATRAMQDADAIFYLINAGKGLPQSDLNALQFIRDHDWQDKLFYGLNMRQNAKRTIVERIAPDIASKLESGGFEVPEDGLMLYHAALGLLACQGRSLITAPERFDRHSRDVMVAKARAQDCRGETPEAVWGEMVQDMMHVLRVPERQDIADTPDADSVDICRRVSGLDPMFDRVERFVLGRRARSILIDNGCEPIGAGLDEFDGDLKGKEAAATQTLEQHRKEVGAAREAVADFRRRASDLVEPLTVESTDAALFADFWDSHMHTLAQEMASRSSERTYEEVLTGWRVTKAVFSSEVKRGVEQDIAQIVSQEFDKALKAHLMVWADQVQRGDNITYNALIGSRVQTISRRMQEEWSRLTDRSSMLDGISLPSLSGSLMNDASKMHAGRAVAATVDLNFLERMGVDGRMIVALVTSVTGAIVASLSAGPVGWAILIIGVISVAIWSIFAEPTRTTVTNKLTRQILDGFNAKLNSDRKKIQDEAAPQLSVFRRAYIEAFKAISEDVQKTLDGRVAVRDALFQGAQAERDRVAAEARAYRLGTIDPLRAEIAAFAADVTSELGA